LKPQQQQRKIPRGTTANSDRQTSRGEACVAGGIALAAKAAGYNGAKPACAGCCRTIVARRDICADAPGV
jgi:hypothetical protein